MGPLYTRRNLIISFISIAGVVLLFVFYTYRNIKEAVRETRKVNESLLSLRALEDLMDDLQDIESGQRGFVISRNTLFLEPYEAGLGRLEKDTIAIRNLYRLYPGRISRLDKLLSFVRQKTDFSANSVALLKNASRDSAFLTILESKGKVIMDSIRQVVSAMETEDRLILQRSNLKRQEAARITTGLLITLVILALLVLAWLLRRLLKEEKLRRENENQISYLAGLTEQTGDAVFSSDAGFIIKSWNKAAEELYGYTREEAAGKNFLELLKSRTSKEERNEIVQTIIRTGFYKGEFEYTARNGNDIAIQSTVSIVKDESGTVSGFVIVHRDITAKKQLEQQLQRFNEELSRQVEEKTTLIKNIVERIRDGFYSLDSNWKFTYVNDYMCKITGKTAADLLDKSIWDEFPDAVSSPAYVVLKNAFREQKQSEIEFYFPPLEKWFLAHIYPSPTGLSVFFRDVTEINKAEEEIRSSNERFNLISRTTNDAIWEWNLETGEMWGNEIHQQLYGLTLADPVPNEEDWQKRLHPDDRDNLMKKQEQALASGTNVFITEYRFKTDKEGYRNIYDRCYIVRNKEGKAIRMLGNMMDITERKKAEEALEQSEKKYRAYFENSMDGILLTSMEGGVFAANQAACTIFGMTEKEICEVGRAGLTDLSDPRLAQLLEERRRTGKAKGEITLIRKNGERFPADIASAVFTDAAGNMRTSMIVRDITERKKAEQQLLARENHLRTILNSEPECIKLLGPGGELLEMNPAGLSMIEADNLEMVLNKSVLGIILPEYREAFSQLTASVYQGNSGKLVFEIVGLKGTRRWLETHAVPMKDENGKIISLLGITRDITENRRAEQAIISSEKTRRLIMNSALDAIVCIDKKGFITVWNPQAEKIFGWNESEALGRSLAETIIPERYKVQHTQGMRRYMETGQGPVLNRLLELTARSREGNEFPIELSIIPVKQGETEFFCAFIRDITERKKSEQALKESEEKLRQILGSSADDFYVIDRNYLVIMINKTAQKNLEQVFGKEVVTGTYMPDIFPLERRESIKKNYELVFAGERVEYEFAVNIEGKTYWRRVQYGPVMDESGYINGAFVTTADITEKKKAEIELAKNEEKYRTLVEQASDGIFILGPQGHFLTVNNSCSRISGYSESELKQMTFIDVSVKEDLEKTPPRFDELKQGNATTTDRRMRKKDGNVIDIEITAKQLTDGNILVFARDITERKKAEEALRQSEEKYRTLVEQAVDAIALYDASGKILDVNTGSVNLLGYSRDELLGMSLKDVLTGEEIRVNPVRYDVLQEGKSTVKQRKMRRKDGTVLDTEVRSQQLPDGRFLSVIRDLSERIKAEKDLQESYKTLRELTGHLQNIREEERSNIAREIHDELGQQLTVLKMDISWLNKKLADPGEKIKERMEGLLEMIDDTVRSVRRISSELRPSMLDDLGLPAAIDWHAHEFGKRSGIRIVTEIDNVDEKLPGKIAITLFRVFQECLTNVVRHAGASRVNVRLSQKDNRLQLEIKDNGKGFLLKEIENNKTLGILGMKERVSLIGGEYSIDSVPGKGTTVRVSVPVPVEH